MPAHFEEISHVVCSVLNSYFSAIAPVTERHEGSREALTRTKSSEDSIRSREKEDKSRETFGSKERLGSNEKTGSKERTGSKEKGGSKETLSKEQSKEQIGSKEGSAEGRDVVRKSGTAKDEQTKRRGAVYHEEEVPSFEFGFGRRGSSASSGDLTKGGSSSDEYKRRLHDMQEKYRDEKVVDDGVSIRFYKILVIVLAIAILLSIVLLLFLYIYMQKATFIIDDEDVVRSLEVHRSRFGVMSENLDCSIHMRRRHLQGDDYQKAIRQGLMCLYALAPHTVHEKSAFQLIFSYTQSYAGVVDWLARKPQLRTCSKKDTHECELRSLWNLTTAYTYAGRSFNLSALNSVWLEEGNNFTREAEIWSRSFWNGTSYGIGDGRMKRRKFRVPPLLVKLANRTRNATKLLGDWNKRFPNINLKNLSTKDTITISEEEAKHAASIFAYSRFRRRTITPDISFIVLRNDVSGNGRLKIIYPRPSFERISTLSFLTAFVVRVVIAADNELTRRGVSRKPRFQIMSVNALKIAIKHLKETRYWTGNEQNKTIRAAAFDEAVRSIVNRNYDRRPLKIKRNSTDRATSILMWEKNKHVDAMLMLELSLPHPFDPTAGTGVPREYPRFVHDDGEKSIPYISSGGVMLTLTKDGETRAIMAASASGSEGAVQGVADAILMMLYHKTAGGAAELKHVYLDLSDGRVHCSNTGNEEFIYWYGTECDSVEENLIEGYVPERKVMAVTVDEDYYDYTSMAMTQEDDDYNYAVGF